MALSGSLPQINFGVQDSTPTRAASDAAQPLFDPPRNLATRPEDEGRDALNLHASGDQRILLSQNSGL
ncbi:hypothetical protein TNCV_4998351 [Trichonephila clavipes]|nr:hypothetical protein TNCV_4998351 [Trichonephila clavipes]